ncbi:hypothetical protein [Catellatospora tritici]|uniref:hypothetical protein n=1 Tax=Catellatospora tritici TaxID=2851566 RepID=UPI001C2CFB7B|nr:hypothetical protein [Catellatospora tritici]MBV1850232.1 hypothetical protein [Catellatospora tritici]
MFAVADFERTFDQDHQVNYAYGVVPACGEKAASSTTEGRAVVAWSRAWWTGHGIAGQDAYVLPKQTAATVLAKVKSNLAGCGSFSEDDVTYHKTAKHQVKLPAGFTGSVAACFEGSGDTACFAYLGRGHVVTRLFSSAEDQAGAQRQLQALMAPVAARLQRLPA